MPTRPKKPCAYPGCPNLTNEKYCEVHKKCAEAEYDRSLNNRSSDRFYTSPQWRKKRADFLIEHPFCEECRKQGRLTKAQMVDHIKPIKQGGALLEDYNLQALCNRCHSRKSIIEGSRYGRR